MTKTRNHLRTARLALFAVAITAALRAAAPPPSQLEYPEARELVHKGLDLLMNGDPDAATEVFRQIQSRDPQSPLGYLYEADAVWWKIYYTTANLVDPEVLDVVSSPTTPYDSHFEDLVNLTITRAAALRSVHRDEARNNLNQALAYALRARLAGLRGQDLPTARAGKKMRSFCQAALRLDPNLTDAYLGLGIYNYFVDTLPTIVKLLRFLIALPGGSRQVGLEQLHRVIANGDLTVSDARFQLAKDYSRHNERQYAKSLELFQGLARDYPGNPLWTLLMGSLECRLDRPQPCEAAYRDVLKQTPGELSEVKRAVHAAAVTALQRLHPDEKIE